MNSPDNTAANQSAPSESANPFVAFRRFADEQVSSLLQSVIGLPSAFNGSSSTPRSSSFDDDAWLQEARELRHHLAREADEAAKMVSLFGKAVEEGNKDLHGETDHARCPYRPMDEDIPQCNQEPTLDAVPLPCSHFPGYIRLLYEPCELDSSPLWPMLYAAASPYSPLRLEHQDIFRNYGNKWRNAFEDLMAMQSGISMPEKDDRREYDNGASWISSMVEKGSFGKGWQRMAEHRQISEKLSTISKNAGFKQPEDYAEEDESDQSQLYERFLGAQYPSANSSSPQNSLIPNLAPSSLEDEKPSLICTLTTTERNKLPDGSTHTKVVLKKRFSDGREESTETVHTAYDFQQSLAKSKPISSAETMDVNSKATLDNNLKNPKQNGWFWS